MTEDNKQNFLNNLNCNDDPLHLLNLALFRNTDQTIKWVIERVIELMEVSALDHIHKFEEFGMWDATLGEYIHVSSHKFCVFCYKPQPKEEE